MPLASVVIPAHNESAVIARCLDALIKGTQRGDLEIIVVCNGCRDNTAEIAKRYDGVEVVELTQASKSAALNAGDRLRSDLPVVYLDADAVLDFSDLQLCITALEDERIKIVSPMIEVNNARSSFAVRAFYSVWLKLPYFSDCSMVGSGAYVLSRSGRSRFADFPEVIADDGYVRSLFVPSERLTLRSAKFQVFAPQDLKTLIRIKTRVRVGNKQIKQKHPQVQIGGDNKSVRSLSFLIRKPWLIPATMIYAYVQIRTIVMARQRLAAGNLGWDRDESSRQE